MTDRMTYTPSQIARSVTPAAKRAFWAAIEPPARLPLGDIATAAGISFAVAAEIWAEGLAAGRLQLVDHGPGWRWIERVA